MRTVKIIDTLHLNVEGVKAKTKNGKLQTVHLRQGDLDGACAVYSTLMVLIMIKALKFSDLQLSEKRTDKRLAIEKLKKELFELRGFHRSGNYLYSEEYEDIRDLLRRSFSKKVLVEPHIMNESDIVIKIKETLLNNLPVLISISYKGEGAHAVVAIGAEFDNKDNISKIFCLDPDQPSPKLSYWNSVLDLKKTSSFYRYQSLENEETLVQIQDILVISSKK